MSDYRSHLSVTLWAALVVLAMGTILILPERVFSTQVLGSPASFVLTTDILVALVAIAIVCAGLEAAIRTHPKQAILRNTFRFWALPSAIVMAAALVLPAAPTNGLWFGVLAFSGLSLAAAMVAEYHTVDQEDRHFRSARLTLNIMVYALAALAFVLIYVSRNRSLISATAIGILAGLLAFDLLRETDRPLRDVFLYSFIVALLMAQITWVFNYWPVASTRMGLLLLVAFYLIAGLFNQELAGRLTLRRVGEYIGMAGIAAAVIILFP